MNPTEKGRLEVAARLLNEGDEADRRKGLRQLNAVLRARTGPPEEKRLRKVVEELAAVVVACVAALDDEFSRSVPDTPDARQKRGSRVAQIRNALEMEGDRALYFGLQLPFERQKKFKRRALAQYGREPKTTATREARLLANALAVFVEKFSFCPLCNAAEHSEGCPVEFWKGKDSF